MELIERVAEALRAVPLYQDGITQSGKINALLASNLLGRF